jgi:hypothetical protein
MGHAVDFVANYTATDAGVYLTADRREGLLMFCTSRGWIGVTLDRDQLAGLKDRISGELNRRPPPAKI